ncbi:MAG: hypothetical protein QXO51_02425 [Halobacteria archaeon]
MISLAAVGIGFVLFFAVLVQAWDGHEERQDLLRSFRESLVLADTLRKDPALTLPGRPDILDGERLRESEAGRLLGKRFARGLHISLNVTTESWRRLVGPPPPDRTLVAAVPVAVAWSPARVEAGSLRVALWR